MRKVVYSFTLFSLMMILNAGCGEKFKMGALETMELWSSGNAYYNAKFIDEDEYSGPTGEIYPDSKNTSNGVVKYYHYYHSDKSPKKLGYTEGPHTDADGRKMWYHKDGYTNPGSEGVWSDGQKSTGGGTSGGGGTCSSSYNSPTTDAQLDAFCGYAWLYRCQQGKSLSSPEVQAVCKSYNDLKTSSAPDCPYCK